MTENGTKSYPVRTLTVENFSVIKHAKLEFGKITVLIGPQASGKSLLCKLAYFLSNRTIEEAVTAILSANSHAENSLSSYNEFIASLCRVFLAWFPKETWEGEKTCVTLESHAFRVQVSAAKHLDGLDVLFSNDFVSLFYDLVALVQRLSTSGAESRRYLAEQVRVQFHLLLTKTNVDRPLYIPDGRAFFANQSLGFNLVNNPDIDPILKEFSLEVSWGSSLSPDPILGDEGVRVLQEIRHEIVRIAGGNVEGRNGSARFRRSSDGKSIPLPFVSSGTQAMLPMFNVLWQMITEQRGRILFPRPDNLPGMPSEIILSEGLVYVEEPEANIFPSTQYELIRLFAWLSQEWRLRFSWVITTHSPYILSAFGNLLKAGKVGSQNAEHHAAVEKTVAEKYWIKSSDFAAYKIENETLVSIFDRDTGQIDGDYLDDVSSDIAEEFGQLLEIQYGG
jgi:predicted ATPase